MKNVFHVLKIFSCAFLFFFLAEKSFCSNNISKIKQGFGEYTLENGMAIFAAEDVSSALVRIEFVVRAGYSAQDPDTTGFFSLYTKLFASSGKSAYYENGTHRNITWHLENVQATCTADAARFVFIVAPEQVYEAMEQLSACLVSPLFLNEELETTFESMKQETLLAAENPAWLINASIDSRIFPDAPWKHESGIYPALFSSMQIEELRTKLYEITGSFYTPDNSAIFISGCISKEGVLDFAKNAFMTWKGSARFSPATFYNFYVDNNSDDNSQKQSDKHNTASASTTAKQQKKFVIHDSNFSKDITQLVMQYTSLGMAQSDIAAAIFGNNSSAMKKELFAEKSLAIRDPEYINAAAVHRRGSDRLIIQSILENPNSNPVAQSELFARIVNNASTKIQQAEINSACARLINNYNVQVSNVSSFMILLVDFWVTVSNKSKLLDTDVVAQLETRPANIRNFNLQNFSKNFANELPFVFVLVNTEIFNKHKKEFSNAGYEEISTKNASWYSQQLYENMQVTKSGSNYNTPLPSFASENRTMFSEAKLSNGIPVVIKRNPSSSTTTISLVINGGSLYSADNPGFNELMTEALAENIMREIEKKQRANLISDDASVSAESFFSQSIIMIECQSADASECVSCITSALIYGEIKPALADGLIYNRRRQHIINSGSLPYQLSRAAISKLFPQSSFEKIYKAPTSILKNTSYENILDAYPRLLNPSLYKVVIVGDCEDDKIIEALNNSLGLLSEPKPLPGITTESYEPTFNNFPEKISVRLEHKFFTDISADKAGPRPPVLIPTTVFNDPVQYWLPSPKPTEKEFVLFNAICYELKNRINILTRNDLRTIQFKANAAAATRDIHAANITIATVSRRSLADALYAKAVNSLIEDLSDEDNETITNRIKSGWTLAELPVTDSNGGTAKLISNGFARSTSKSIAECATSYLEDYETIYSATAEQFLEVAKKYFSEVAPLAVYSADTPQ